jgi:hypothetical protein
MISLKSLITPWMLQINSLDIISDTCYLKSWKKNKESSLSLPNNSNGKTRKFQKALKVKGR